MMDVELDIKQLLEISQEDYRTSTTEGGHRYHDEIQSRLDNLQPKVIGTLRLFDAAIGTETSSTNSTTTLEQEEGNDDNRNNNVGSSSNSDNHLLLTEDMIENLSLWLKETFGADTGVVIHSLVIYCHSFTFESSKTRKRFISSLIQNLNIEGGQFWIKVGKTISWTDGYDGGEVEWECTSQRNNDTMIVEMLDLLSSSKPSPLPSPLFNPKEIYICDMGPQVIPFIRDFYNHYNCRLDILSIHLGYQYLSPRCHQRFEWTLQNVSDLVNIFNRNDKSNNEIARILSHNTNPQIHLRIHHDSLTKNTTTNNKDIVSQILHVLLEGKSSSSQVVDSSSSISSLALVGFPTPPNNPGKLLTTFLERNHSVETLFPIWKPSGMTTQEKQHIAQLGKLNKDLKRYLKEARLYLHLQQQQQQQQQGTGNVDDDGTQEPKHRQNDLVALPPNLWSIFLAKVASISSSKLYYLLLEGGDFLFFQNR